MSRRVVVTGMAGITAIGQDWAGFRRNAAAGKTGIVHMDEWDRIEGLNTRLGGPVPDFELPAHYTRKKVRSMGRVARMATVTAERALEQAGLRDDPEIQSGAMGIAYGSSIGSTRPLGAFGNLINEGTMTGITATSYVEMMSHTCAVNIGVFLGLKGRIMPSSSACTSGSQGIGFAYEAVKYGQQTMMLGGGAEELCPSEAAVFDALYATSVRNGEPHLTPRPFDRDRDGLVVGEGAGTLVLEELEHARARGATIFAELVGFGTNCDGNHVTQPTAGTMQVAIELALRDAGLSPEAIGYVNAHGTATDRGDVAESQATAAVFGKRMPISSLKSYLGHTLGACGAIEAWASIEMMNDDWFAGTANLDNVDPACAELDYLTGQGRVMNHEYVMSNNFAFGGINTSLIFRRWQ